MHQHLSAEDKTQEQEPLSHQENLSSNQHHLHVTLHVLLALSLAFRYFFAKSLLPYSFELDFAQDFPVLSELSQTSFFSLEQLDLRLWPLIGFSFCLWLMIGLFKGSVKKAWIYIILIHAIPLMDVFGVMGSPWMGGVCCWILAWRMHIRPFKNKTLQLLTLASLGALSFWWSSLDFYLWPWLIYSYFSTTNLLSFKSHGKLVFYIYLVIYQMFSLYLLPESNNSNQLQFIFDLWPLFLGPIAIICTGGFFVLWCLKSVFRDDSGATVTKELGLLCFLMVAAILMHQHAANASLEAILIMAFLVPFGLLYGPDSRLQRWCIGLCYWTTLSIILIVLLTTRLNPDFSKLSFKDTLVNFESWRTNERITQDLAIRFWQVIEPHDPQIILCQNREMALQMQRYSGRTCQTIEEWKQSNPKLQEGLQRVFIISEKSISLRRRLEWFGDDLEWFLHKQWSLTLNIEDIHPFYIYGSSASKRSILVF